MARTVSEVLFIDRHDTTMAPLAAALMAYHAGSRVNVSSAGVAPGPATDASVVEFLRGIGIDISDSFPKPVTEDALQAADVIIVLGAADQSVPSGGGADSSRSNRRWDLPEVDSQTPGWVGETHRRLENQILRLLDDFAIQTAPDEPQ